MEKVITTPGTSNAIGLGQKRPGLCKMVSAILGLAMVLVVSGLHPIVAEAARAPDIEVSWMGLKALALVQSEALDDAIVIDVTSPEFRPIQYSQIAIADNKAGALSNADNDDVRQTQAEEVRRLGFYALYGTLLGLGIFYLLRGRLRLANGYAGQKIARFCSVERFGHWLMALSFIALALTGLQNLYGEDVLLLLVGLEKFSWLSQTAKWLHQYISFAFLVGLAMAIYFWFRDNMPGREDLKWLITAGGIFSENGYAPAQKFTAGQKVFFWSLTLSALMISITGLLMLMPFQFSIFSPIYGLLNQIGFNLPTNLSPLQELQFATLWHSATGIFMMLLVGVHIYFNTIGTVGSLDAMTSGEVDVNWAREHRSLWAEDVLGPDPKADNDGSGAARPSSGNRQGRPGHSQPIT